MRGGLAIGLLVWGLILSVGCHCVDEWLGNEDGDFLAASLASAQPDVTSNGILVDVRVYARGARLLRLEAANGVIKAPGSAARQAVQCLEIGSGSHYLPISVLPSGQETILDGALLEIAEGAFDASNGIDAGADAGAAEVSGNGTECTGHLLQAFSIPVHARVHQEQADAGAVSAPPDADVIDAAGADGAVGGGG